MGYYEFKKYCTPCAECGATTSKSFARTHNGRCKACATSPTGEDGQPDISNHPLLCPTCRERLRTQYQKRHGYHCDACTRAADPEGWAREMRTPQEPPDPADSY